MDLAGKVEGVELAQHSHIREQQSNVGTPRRDIRRSVVARGFQNAFLSSSSISAAFIRNSRLLLTAEGCSTTKMVGLLWGLAIRINARCAPALHPTWARLHQSCPACRGSVTASREIVAEEQVTSARNRQSGGSLHRTGLIVIRRSSPCSCWLGLPWRTALSSRACRARGGRRQPPHFRRSR